MSSGLLAGQKIEYSRDREENGQRENTGETTKGTKRAFIFILMFVFLIEQVLKDGRKPFAANQTNKAATQQLVCLRTCCNHLI